MKRLQTSPCLFAVVVAAFWCSGSPKQVGVAGCLPSQPLYQGTIDQIVFDGSSFVPTPFDVYHMVVENTTPFDLFTLQGVTFNGPWLQESPVPIFAQTGTALPPDPFDAVVPPVGDNFTPDTFFTLTDPSATLFSSGEIDTNSALGATTVASLGAPWIAAGATETIAVLTVPAGTPLDLTSPGSFYGHGGFIVDGEIYGLCYPPEPSSCMLTVIGLTGLVIRRGKQKS